MSGVFIKETDIRELSVFNGGKQLRDAVKKHFTADKSVVWMKFGHPYEVLASAKADLQPAFAGQIGGKGGSCDHVRPADPQRRQQVTDKFVLMRPEGFPLAPAKE